MKDLLGFNGLTEAADKILDGTLFHNVDEMCFPGVKELVASMAIPTELKGIKQLNTERSIADFKKGIKGWKESTSTSDPQ